MTAADVVAMLTAALWMTAVGLLSYRAGLRRGLALADGAGLAEDDGGWDYGETDADEVADD